ncbi:hypothetical protein [Acidimangrovimonas sediminis]|uniref:hypothetical protein n=1 Tax=Acidimangrovimonas sediminis TaxID=2056283 RepID=UPI000C80D336
MPNVRLLKATLHPGATLSLQIHPRRAKHRIEVECIAKMIVYKEMKLAIENQWAYIS